MRRAALHADSGPAVGLGHVTRCRALAAALAETNVEAVFLPEDAGAPPDARGLAAAVRDGTGVLVVDSYRLDLAELDGLIRERDVKLVYFDDTLDRRLPVDMAVNGSPAAPATARERRLSDAAGRTRYLLGPDYQIIRADLRRPVRDGGTARHVLILVGGGDSRGLAGTLAAAVGDWLAARHPEAVATLVLGPLHPPTDLAEGANLRVRRAPEDMAAVLSSADVAVTAGGQSVFELAFAGTPMVAFAYDSRQAANLEVLARGGCLVNAGHAADADLAAAILTALDRLLSEPDTRAALGRAAADLCDGQGARRVAAEIGSLFGPAPGRASREEPRP